MKKNNATAIFNKSQLIFLCILSLAVFITKIVVAFHPWDVLPRDDELYYLFFSENLRLVYPEHTPMVAYSLAFARLVFNLLVPGTFEDYLPSSLALVPISSTVYFLFLYAFIYIFIVKFWKNKALAILILLTFFLTPYLWGVSFLTTPETPLTFFAFPAVLLFAHAFLKQPENLKVWLLAGLFLAGAFLGKILAIPLGVAIALYAIVSQKRSDYLRNYRFYLAFAPAIIAGLVVLYGDYLDNFSMIQTLFARDDSPSTSKNIDTFFNQFIYYTPLFFSLILFLPAINIFSYTRKNILPRVTKKKQLPATNTHILQIDNEKKTHFYEELLFYLAILSVFCTSLFLYKLFTIRVLNWWSGFTAAPNIIFICVWMQKKISSSTKTHLPKIAFTNFLLTGIFCIFASFHSVYGVVDANYNFFKQVKKTSSQSTNDIFSSYNIALNKFAFFIKTTFGQYPEENSDWLHKYKVLTTDFKEYYDEKMDKTLPIVGVNFRPSLYIYYYVQPNHKPMALTVSNSEIPAENRDFLGFFNSLFNLKELKGQSFYLITFVDSITTDEYINDTLKLPLAPYYCRQEKIFRGYRLGKPISAFPLYLCKNDNLEN